MVAILSPAKDAKCYTLTTKGGLLDYTRYMFMEMYGRRFVVNSHHRAISALLDRVANGELTKVMINISPRYGKTELAVKNFISRGLSLNAASKYIHLSYSDDLALDNSEGVKSIVEHEAYQALFPKVQIKKDSRAKKKWYTTAGGGVYATSTAGQVTGFGAGSVDEEAVTDENSLDEMLSGMGINGNFGGALIIDDPIKPEDADADLRRNRINERYDSTIKNRVNSRNTPIIIIMQRVHELDLCGYLLQNEPGEWTVLSLPAIQTDEEGNETALWPFKHTIDELRKLRTQNPVVFGRQYMQNPTPIGGVLYAAFRTYEVMPTPQRSHVTKAYIDTADLGIDYLCAITYEETQTAIYVTDVLYTQSGMETTEPQSVKLIQQNGVSLCRVESNNGGRGFARNVEDGVRKQNNTTTRFVWFHQSDNKHNRIFTASSSVMNLIYFPYNWQQRWPVFARHVLTYMAAGKNAHDDAPDVLTGMTEFFGKDKPTPFFIT